MTQSYTVNPNGILIEIQERVVIKQYLSGSPGSQTHFGIGVPETSFGNTKDIFIDKTSGRMYKKEGAVWGYQYTMTGSVEP